MSNVNTTVSNADLLKQIADLKAANAALTSAAKAKISLKVSAKGAVSVYGMGRFPVTLYASQWATLLDMSSTIQDFIKANAPSLAVKGAAKAA
jgi:hypothetical protein